MTRFIPANDTRIKDLIEAMGLPYEKIRRLTIDIAVDAIVVTIVEVYNEATDLEKLTEITRQFRLVPIKPKKR